MLRILLLYASFFHFSFARNTIISFPSNLALMISTSFSLNNHWTVSPGISNIKGILSLSSNLLVAVSLLKNCTSVSKSNPEGKLMTWIV